VQGLFALHLPKQVGGLGLPLPEIARVSEELGRSPLGYYAVNMQVSDVGNMEILMLHGTDAQKERFLGPLARGEARSCFAMMEFENAGSNPVMLDARVEDKGDHWELHAHKWFITGVDGAAFAIVMAVTDPDASLYLRASQILVPLPAPGYSLVRNLAVMGEEGGGWGSHGETRFDGVKVPKENLLGGRGAGFV